MMSSLFIGATGLKTHGQGVGNIGHNISNVNTVGYKRMVTTFESLYNETLPTTGGPNTDSTPKNLAQMGKGVGVAAVRTVFEQGHFDPSNTVTDLAIGGKGFFQVAQDGEQHFTRAGNFRFDNSGYLIDPNGYRLQGNAIDDDGNVGGLADIRLSQNSASQAVDPGSASTAVTMNVNLGDTSDNTQSATNPFFSMLENWGTDQPPLGSAAFNFKNSIQVYDSAGESHSLDVYFDGASVSNAGGKTYMEFAVSSPDAPTGSGAAPYMTGVLVFSSSGQMEGMSAYTPTAGTGTLSDWAPASFDADGHPQFNAVFDDGAGGTTTQTMSLNFGFEASAGAAWSGGGATAADVGADPAGLPAYSGTRASRTTTAFEGSSSSQFQTQDGYAEGYLTNISIDTEGVLSGKYSNGNSKDLYEIPLFYFTNQWGLKREGDNHYSATKDSGAALEGKPETNGLGKVHSSSIEMSNVDIAREFVSMITMQRGFQANSRIITTTDRMIQTATQMKR